MREILPITSLRFLAAFLVFLFHVHIRWPLAPEGSVADAVLSQGAIGMSLFFILSGFVLTYRYYESTHDYRNYAVHRVSRIVPVYVVAALVTLPWLNVPWTARGGLQATLLILLDGSFMQAWFPQTYKYWNNAASWSISVEAFFYALFPLLLIAGKRLTGFALGIVALCAWLLAVLPGVAYTLLPDRLPFTVPYAMPIFRLPEFIIGMVAGLAFMRHEWTPKHASALVAVAWSVLLVYLATLARALPEFIFVVHNWLVVPVVALTIYVSARISAGPLYWLLCSAPLVYLGRISYSFYSMQILVFLLIVDHRARLVESTPALGSNLALAIFAFLTLLALSALCYHLIEEPSRKYLSKHYRRRSGYVGARP